MSFSPYAGRTGLTLEAMSDRLAVLNLIGAYAHYANVGDIEGWGGLFHQDAHFIVSSPGEEGRPVPKAEIIASRAPIFAEYRRRCEDPSLGERKVYRFNPPFIRHQTATEIELVVNLAQFSTPPDGSPPHILFTATYEGKLIREGGDWTIIYWAVSSSRPPVLPASAWRKEETEQDA